MIQRIQSVFLLIVSLVSGFWGYQMMSNPLLEWQKFVVFFVALSSFLNIFRFNNRQIQKNSCAVLLLLELIAGVGVFFLPTGSVVVEVLPMGLWGTSILFTILAYLYIQKDIKYVRSMDSLR